MTEPVTARICVFVRLWVWMCVCACVWRRGERRWGGTRLCFFGDDFFEIQMDTLLEQTSSKFTKYEIQYSSIQICWNMSFGIKKKCWFSYKLNFKCKLIVIRFSNLYLNVNYKIMCSCPLYLDVGMGDGLLVIRCTWKRVRDFFDVGLYNCTCVKWDVRVFDIFCNYNNLNISQNWNTNLRVIRLIQ